tara:strand:+ start:2823 stop:3044 length:222 start_codon:yes stop_codon:yes gene_type:complete
MIVPLNSYRIVYRTGENKALQSYVEVKAGNIIGAILEFTDSHHELSKSCEIIYVYRVNIMPLPIGQLLTYGTA